VCHADVIIELYKEAMAAVEGDRLVAEDAPPSDSEDSDAASSACADSPRTRASRFEFQRASVMEGIVADEVPCDTDPIAKLMEGPIPTQGLFAHVKIGTWHRGSDAVDKLACKRNMVTNGVTRYQRMGAWPSTSATWCSDCRRILASEVGEVCSDGSDEESA
jgi:hypothetical protein